MKGTTNRNLWTTEEDNYLLKQIEKFGIMKGIKTAANKLGRSADASSQRYYSKLKKEKTAISNSSSKPIINISGNTFTFDIKEISIDGNKLKITV